MKSFKINNEKEIVCEWKKTRNGFKHEATLLINGSETETAKCCYLNRTWESYEFQSVINSLLNKTKLLTDSEKEEFKNNNRRKSHEEVESQFKTIAMIASLGEIFATTTKDKNDWKVRMLKAGLQGIDIPEDWDNLDEDTKAKRLDAVIAFAKTGVK